MCMTMRTFIQISNDSRDWSMPIAVFATFSAVWLQADPDLGEPQKALCFVGLNKQLDPASVHLVKASAKAFVIWFSESRQHCHCTNGSKPGWSQQKHKTSFKARICLKNTLFVRFWMRFHRCPLPLWTDSGQVAWKLCNKWSSSGMR